MVDTPRLLSALQTLLADNTVGAISPQDIRDFLVSAVPSGRAATKVVAASSASDLIKAQADEVCDGTADDVQIQAAIDAVVAAGGGLVFLSEGLFAIVARLDVPTNVSLVGSNAGATIIQASAALTGSMIGIDYAAAVGNRSGVCTDIYLDGNNNAERCWDIGLAINRLFINCRAENANGVGFVLRRSQNNLFLHCISDNNGDAANNNGGGLRLNHGAGNNVFVNCQISDNRFHGIVFAETVTLDDEPAGTGFSTPQHNKFIGCQIERNQAQSTAQIRFRAGRNNGFIDCNLQTSGARTLFALDNTDGTVALNYVRGGFAQVDAANGTLAQIENHFKFRWLGVFAENAGTGFKIDDNSTLVVDSACHFSNITTFFTALGAKTIDQLVLQDINTKGWVSENSGTATLVNGQTSIVVAHGLDFTPTAKNITVTPIEAWGAMTQFWTNTFTATEFTINVDQNPGQDVDFAWTATNL
ncbi:hypothetical protein LCGC14_2170990 [marine sediment metagenome]|uniref:Right handed beta helix domain-containing protein n=1 Tax=marine sediment metagenome TaxID=412755 RepID=A0A0F9DQ89_9ZZZZ